MGVLMSSNRSKCKADLREQDLPSLVGLVLLVSVGSSSVQHGLNSKAVKGACAHVCECGCARVDACLRARMCVRVCERLFCEFI